MKKKQKIIELENLLFLSKKSNSGLVKSNVKLTNNLNALELSNDNLRKENKLTDVKLNYFEAKLNVTIKELRQTQSFLKKVEVFKKIGSWEPEV